MTAAPRPVLSPVEALSLLACWGGAWLVWLWPAASGQQVWIGAWPLWLLLMPGSALATLVFRRVLTARGATLAVPPRRRPRRLRLDARPALRARSRRWQLAALHPWS